METAAEDVCVTLPWDDIHIYTWHFVDEWELRRQKIDFPPDAQAALYSFMRHYINLTSLHGLQSVHARVVKEMEPIHPSSWICSVELQAYVGMIWVHSLMHRIDRRTVSCRRIPLSLAPAEAWAIQEALSYVILDLADFYQAGGNYPFSDFGYFPDVMDNLYELFTQRLNWLQPNPLLGYYRIIPELPQKRDWAIAQTITPEIADIQ
jgi:hypothetical protein